MKGSRIVIAKHHVLMMIGCIGLVWMGGCPPETYPDVLGVTFEEVTRITNDDELTPQEQREALEELGLSSSTINSILRTTRTANQDGGDLRTAYNKLVEPAYQKLTPDEIQIFADQATELDDEIDVELNDEAALEISRVLIRSDIDSPEDMQTFLDRGGSVPGEVPDGALEALFIDFDLELLVPELP